MVKKILIISLILTLSSCLKEAGIESSESPVFIRLFNGGYDDTAHDVQETDDEGFILLGTTEIKDPESTESLFKIKLIKTDKFGNVQWVKIYPSFNNQNVSYKGRFLIPNKDSSGTKNGYLIVGDSMYTQQRPYIKVILVDNQGNIIKSSNIGTAQHVGLEGMAATITRSGSYVILASIKEPAEGQGDVYITELDQNFEPIWVKTYGAGSTTLINRLHNEEESNELFWAGSVNKTGTSSIRFVKTLFDTQAPAFDLPIGNLESVHVGKDFCRYGTGFAVVGSTTQFGNSDIFIAQLNQNGSEIFSSTYSYDNNNSQEEGLSIAATQDGGFIVLGSIENQGITAGEKDFYLAKINAFGEKKWQNILGGRNNDIGVRVLTLSDNGLLVLGTTSFGGLSTITLLRTNPYGKIE